MQSKPNAFSPARFLADARRTAARIDAPFCAATTRRAVEAFAEGFHTGAVLWKTTSRPGDALSYRFYSRIRSDTTQTAARAGLIPPDSPVTGLIRSWSALNEDATQSCDFDAHRGLAKCWVYLGGTLPLEAVLGADRVPQALRRQEQVLRERGLDHVRFLAVDYLGGTVNLYFRVRGPYSGAQHRGIAGLAGSPAPPERTVREIRGSLPRQHYLAAVTLSLTTGLAERVCFYATRIPDELFPDTGARLGRFFAAAPSHDPTDVNVLAWSFGPAGTAYLKGERSYCGDLAGLFTDDWRVLVSGTDQTDPALMSEPAARR
ncbi:aromatic prenyltransferase [Streptomyces sp. TS71-3]|uniref:aromatic prenyltransferase n=1 Tax=Streptomyces sp. TS71-3 TaxID=2733862 RepID=UPI001B1FF83B|nr:aromatic prenyltransferase [Streptomyces sp. TS71-3]GHJ35663.1 hypothetical protein Sm713_12720 [Streptomyces sp. TS71-3]